MTSYWTRDDVAGIDWNALPATPVIRHSDVASLIGGIDLWDMWPVQEFDGRVAAIAGGSLWFALSAPIIGDPVERHSLARLRLLHLVGGRWRDLGPALPDGLSPGSREWSGSTIVSPDHRRATLFFTAAGERGEAVPTFRQRLFQASAALDDEGHGIGLRDWAAPVEAVRSDGVVYHPADQREGAVGTIKAFRDPAFFRDPGDRRGRLLFTASDGRSASPFNGVIGVATAQDESLADWRLEPPLISADGLNNELERPHMLVREGRYYLFWSTQHSVFDPAGPVGPTGLYGMVADSIDGPYCPLNGTGLVLCNPGQAPHQAYSWLVLDDLTVVSFIDQWGISAPCPASGAVARRQFGGVPAPVRRLRIDGDKAW